MGLFCFEFFWGGRMCKVITSKDSPERDAINGQGYPEILKRFFFKQKSLQHFGLTVLEAFQRFCWSIFWHPNFFLDTRNRIFSICKTVLFALRHATFTRKKRGKQLQVGGGEKFGGSLAGKSPQGLCFPNSKFPRIWRSL